MPEREALAEANLYAVCELIAARAARPSTRRRSTRASSGASATCCGRSSARPPTVADVTVDAIAGYARLLERQGGRGGGPASPATRRVQITMLRALAGQLGLEHVARDVRPPSHRVGPPETLTPVQYANLLRAPDRRTLLGRRDYALLRVLGDCGLRNAELRALPARAIRRPRANSRHHSLYVHGKGGVEREVPLATATHAALEAWLAGHPLRRGASGLRGEEPVFVRLAARSQPGPLSNAALHKLLRRHARRRHPRAPQPPAHAARLLRHHPGRRRRPRPRDRRPPRPRQHPDDQPLPGRARRRHRGRRRRPRPPPPGAPAPAHPGLNARASARQSRSPCPW